MLSRAELMQSASRGNSPTIQDEAPLRTDIPEFLTPEQVTRFYGIRGLGVRRCRGNGPPFVKCGDARGSKILYARSSVESWLRARQFANTTEHSAAVAMAEANAAA